MSQSLKGLGVPVNFGFKATSSDGGITATPFTAFLLQKSSLKTVAEVERVRYLQGDVASENYYGAETEGDLTFVISKSAGTATTIAATSLASFTAGTIIAVTACASSPDWVNSYWICQPGAEITQETTKSAELRVPLKQVPNITAAQGSG
jgi:glucosamine 6-phosphate synthetase-like amidotransferase/phosphosugar isomerase protein